MNIPINTMTWEDRFYAVEMTARKELREIEKDIKGKSRSKRALLLRQIIERAHKDVMRLKYPDETMTASQYERREINRKAQGVQRAAKALALRLGVIGTDEHGTSRGEYSASTGLDFVAPRESVKAPYLDMGGRGLAVIDTMYTTVYARSCKWRPSTRTERFLIGRNEAGTAFAHPVPVRPDTTTVRGALRWIWRGYEPIKRQGDIAIVVANGPKMPTDLPWGHFTNREKGIITHATHPDLELPGKGERLIVGRRSLRGVGTRD